MDIMWQRFTESARQAVYCSQEEAGRFGQAQIAPEHLLLGLIRDSDSPASRILDRLGIAISTLQSEIERQLEQGSCSPDQSKELTPRAKRVIELAYEEARQMNSNYIGTEHLLLGLIREREGPASTALMHLGASLEGARREVMSLQDNDSGAPPLEEWISPDASADDARWITMARGILQQNAGQLRGASLLSMADLNREQIESVLDVAAGMTAAHRLKTSVIHWRYPRSLAMIFEKPSLRTRVTFDLGMQQMGGIAIALGPAEIGLGTRESIPDAARNLERWVDAIMARVFHHNTLTGLCENCRIPVINGLSDREHPCQALADLFTIRQKKGKLEGLKLAWVGDGNNVLHSLLLGCATVGMSVSAACPPGYAPDPAIVSRAIELAGDESRIQLGADPAHAVVDADVVYTDVWTSMGQESEREERLKLFRPYQVSAELMTRAKPDALFMHCLPAHRGEEVTDEVIDSPCSVVFDQAENRLHAQKAILALLLGP